MVSLKRFRGSAVSVAVIVIAACADGGEDTPGATGGAPVVQEPPAPSQTLRPPTIGSTLSGAANGEECIRGGTTRDDVRAIMGQPDSVSFGVWLYGRSEIAFGYGVVVAYDDVDENLPLCP